jgi:hypothetical protein
VRFIYPCRFGEVISADADGSLLPFEGDRIGIPAGAKAVTVAYR